MNVIRKDAPQFVITVSEAEARLLRQAESLLNHPPDSLVYKEAKHARAEVKLLLKQLDDCLDAQSVYLDSPAGEDA